MQQQQQQLQAGLCTGQLLLPRALSGACTGYLCARRWACTLRSRWAQSCSATPVAKAKQNALELLSTQQVAVVLLHHSSIVSCVRENNVSSDSYRSSWSLAATDTRNCCLQETVRHCRPASGLHGSRQALPQQPLPASAQAGTSAQRVQQSPSQQLSRSPAAAAAASEPPEQVAALSSGTAGSRLLSQQLSRAADAPSAQPLQPVLPAAACADAAQASSSAGRAQLQSGCQGQLGQQHMPSAARRQV